jgi:hypothetical protein
MGEELKSPKPPPLKSAATDIDKINKAKRHISMVICDRYSAYY